MGVKVVLPGAGDSRRVCFWDETAFSGGVALAVSCGLMLRDISPAKVKNVRVGFARGTMGIRNVLQIGIFPIGNELG